MSSMIATFCKRYKPFLSFLLYTVAYYLVFLALNMWMEMGYNVPFQGVARFLRTIILNFLPIFLLALLQWLIVFKFPLKSKKLGLKIILDVVLSFGALWFDNQLFTLLRYKIDIPGSVLNNIMLMFGVEMIYYVNNMREVMEREAKAREEVLIYQYKALKAQVSPHFLFNSLNIMYSLTTIDIKKTQEFIMSLSQIYRYIMAQQNMQRVALSEEVRFLKSYIEVLRLRYHGAFDIEINGKEYIQGQEIIPYTMQLLIENVHKHNVISETSPMHVTISIEDKQIVVSNPINKKLVDTSTGIGLQYITKLYRLNQREVKIINDGETFTAIIPYL